MLIVCEGRNTEPLYFKTLRSALRLHQTVEIEVRGDTPHTDPCGLVQDALNLREQRLKLAKKTSVQRPYDQVWVVFDTEWPGKHPRIKEAIQQAVSTKLNVAISKPSFETWHILHVKDTPPGCACAADAVRVLQELDSVLSSYGKNEEQARKAAEWSLQEKRLPRALQHGARQGADKFDETFVQLPIATGTGVHRLVQLLVDSCADAPARRQLGVER